MLRVLASEVAKYRLALASFNASQQLISSSASVSSKSEPSSPDEAAKDSEAPKDGPTSESKDEVKHAPKDGPTSESNDEIKDAPTSESKDESKDETSTSMENVLEEEWTEVVDKDSGATYFWHQKSGATTELGVTKPKGWSSEGDKDSGKEDEEGGRGGNYERFDPRVESFLPDKTGTYAAMGGFLGIFLGWVSQYM
eukprot:gene25877-11548_t